MSKVRNFAEIAPNIGFSEFDFYDLYRSTFEKSELGRMKKLLPLHAMAEHFGLVSKSLRQKLGRRSYFTPEGKVALMFLKVYTDATCYESDMRYPTGPKLLWKGIEKSYEKMCELSKRLGIHRPRTKFIDVQKANNILVDGISFIEELARVRATAMEGSFGTQKEHYDLRRVKARTKQTEILYIFFGIHTANVVQLADRIEQRTQLAAS